PRNEIVVGFVRTIALNARAEFDQTEQNLVPAHTRSTHLRSKSKCTHSLRKLISSKVQESGSPMEPHIMRYITRQKRTLPRPCWCTAQVAVWVRRGFESRAA